MSANSVSFGLARRASYVQHEGYNLARNEK